MNRMQVPDRIFEFPKVRGSKPAANINVLSHECHAMKDIADAANDNELDALAVQALKQGFSFLNHRKDGL